MKFSDLFGFLLPLFPTILKKLVTSITSLNYSNFLISSSFICLSKSILVNSKFSFLIADFLSVAEEGSSPVWLKKGFFFSSSSYFFLLVAKLLVSNLETTCGMIGGVCVLILSQSNPLFPS